MSTLFSPKKVGDSGGRKTASKTVKRTKSAANGVAAYCPIF